MNTKMRDLSDIELQLVGAGGVGDPIGSYGDPPIAEHKSCQPSEWAYWSPFPWTAGHELARLRRL